jgi:hypothetical protein
MGATNKKINYEYYKGKEEGEQTGQPGGKRWEMYRNTLLLPV